MSCTTKISLAKSLANSLSARYSYDMYKGIKFGDELGAAKNNSLLNSVSNIKWLLDKASNGCSVPRLCSTSFVKEDEGYVNNVFQPAIPSTYPDLWKGSVWNSNLEKMYSISSTSIAPLVSPNNHTRILFWEWIGNVPTLVFTTGDLFNIENRSQISIQYSPNQKSYYLKGATLVNDVSDPFLIKVSEEFTSVSIVTIAGTKSPGYPFQNGLTEVVDSKNLIYVRRDANNIDYYSLVDLSLVGTIDTTGLYYQAMKYDCKSDSLLLTGGGNSFTGVNKAVIHQVLFTCDSYTTSTVYENTELRNNNSMILSNGKLLVLTSSPNTDTLLPPDKLTFQVWSTCSPMHLKEEYVTDIEMATGGEDFNNLLGLSKDNNGNIFVYCIDANSTPQGRPSILVFNKDYEFQYKQTLVDGADFSVFETTLYPDFNNSFVNPLTGLTLVHSQNQNGIGGISTYFLDYEVYTQIKPTCFCLTDDQVTTLTTKLKAIGKCK